MTMLETFVYCFNWLVIYGSVVGLAALGVACYFKGIDYVVRAFCRRHPFILVPLCLVTTAYGAVKFYRYLKIPRTDPDMQNIVDHGSYVTNDFAHVSFGTVGLPSDAPILVAYAPADATNESQVVTVADLTLAEWLVQFPGEDGADVTARFAWAFLAVAFQTSRSSISAYIDAEKTFINGKLVTKAGTLLEEGDIVSVRGKGRFLVTEIKNQTKKGRTVVTIKKYI